MTGQHKLLVTALVCVGVVCLLPRPVTSHGRLWEPPGRSTMWQRGFNTPINWDDDQLYCGSVPQSYAGEKCGTCGDPYSAPIPRPNEAGGKYGLGIISRTYTQGQRVTFTAQMTTSHLGYMEFRLCPTNDKTVRATQDCLNRYLLQMADGSGTRFPIGRPVGNVDVDVILPADLTCEQCVLQWRYHAGNSWNGGDNGCQGCGPQEEFYGCADIRITPSAGSHVPVAQNFVAQTPRPTQAPITARPQTARPAAPGPSDGCHAVGIHAGSWDKWCVDNCGMGYCPGNICEC